MKKLAFVFSFASFCLFGCHSTTEYTWTTFEIPDKASLRGIEVFNQNIIWVTGTSGTISKTEDGGKTWIKLSIPNTDSLDFRDIELFSEREAIVMSAGEGAKSNLFKTWDAGLHWKLVLTNAHPEGFFDGMAFTNDKVGFLGGDPVDGKLFVLKTLDRGNTWSRIDPQLLPDLKIGEFGGFAASGSHLTAFDHQIQIATGGKKSRIFRSHNLGETWESIATPIIQGESSQGIFSIDYYNTQIGVAVGGDYTKEDSGQNNVIYTSDGGKSWDLAETFPLYQSSVRFISNTHLIAVGPKTSYYSTDMGKNWNAIEGDGYHTLDIASDGSIWAAGRDGRIGRLNRN